MQLTLEKLINNKETIETDIEKNEERRTLYPVEQSSQQDVIQSGHDRRCGGKGWPLPDWSVLLRWYAVVAVVRSDVVQRQRSRATTNLSNSHDGTGRSCNGVQTPLSVVGEHLYYPPRLTFRSKFCPSVRQDLAELCRCKP